MKTQSKDLEKGAEYRQLLVQAIHSWCAVELHSLDTLTDRLRPLAWPGCKICPCCLPYLSVLVIVFPMLGTHDDD